MHRCAHKAKACVAAMVFIAGVPPMTAALALDVQSLCAHIGNDDHVRPIPAVLVPQARRLFFDHGASSNYIKETTSFRCMNGKVWLCNLGANLNCGKADSRRTSAGAAVFCRQNPGSDVVPMAATGHDTIYEWKCVGNEARIFRQVETVDPRGFTTENWKKLE
ncbi:MAG: hypothetical protein J2P49_03810 [Methylocapsa sp.]|nr:hypothetical protein [Methylocapsa sp.]